MRGCVTKAPTRTCRRYKWSREFFEPGKQRLVGDINRKADSQDVEAMRNEKEQLKTIVVELTLKNLTLKKTCWAGKPGGTNAPERQGRKARDHPSGGTFCLECEEDPGCTASASQHLLSLAQIVSSRRRGGAGRSPPESIMHPILPLAETRRSTIKLLFENVDPQVSL